MRVLEVFDVGLVDASSNVCLIKNKKDPEQLKKFPCADSIPEAEKAKIAKSCVGKKVCQIADLKSLLDPKAACVKDGSFLKKAFYIQVACGATDEQLKDIRYFSLIQVSLGVFGCLAFIVIIKTDYKNRAKVEKLIYRSYALYAKDYTLEIALTAEQTEYFKRDTYSNHKDKSIAEVYQETLIS